MTTPTIADISKYQAERLDPNRGNWDAANWDTSRIDWERFLESPDSPEAVIVRVGDGENLDPCFFRFMEQIHLRNKPWGIYHLFRPKPLTKLADALQQARKVREWVKGDPPAGVWADLEVTEKLTGLSIFQSASAYLEELDRLFGAVTGIYSGAWFLDPNITPTQQRTWSHRPGWWSGYPGLYLPSGWKGQGAGYTLHQFTDDHQWPGMPDPSDASVLAPGLKWTDLRKPPLVPVPEPTEGTVPMRGLSKLVPNHQIGGGKVSAPWLRLSVGGALVGDFGIVVEAPPTARVMARYDAAFAEFDGQTFDANRLAYSMPPKEASARWYAAIRNQINLNPKVRYWSSPIEQIIKTDRVMAWYGDFCKEFARLVYTNHPGRAAALGGWATGTPEFGLWDNWTEALHACRIYDAVISLHRYGPPFILDGNKHATSHPDLYNGLRYRQDYEAFARLGYPDVKIVLEECGADDAGGETRWKNFFPNFEAYWNDHLRPLALAIEEDDYLLYASVFTCMGPGGWDGFNLIDTNVAERIAAFVAEPARELTRMYVLALDSEPLGLQDQIRTHLDALAKDVNVNNRVVPYGGTVTAPAPSLPAGILYLAQVQYGLAVRDAAGVQVKNAAGLGLTFEPGEILTVYAEKQTAGTFQNRVKISKGGLNVWDGTGDVRGPALKKV